MFGNNINNKQIKIHMRLLVFMALSSNTLFAYAGIEDDTSVFWNFIVTNEHGALPAGASTSVYRKTVHGRSWLCGQVSVGSTAARIHRMALVSRPIRKPEHPGSHKRYRLAFNMMRGNTEIQHEPDPLAPEITMTAQFKVMGIGMPADPQVEYLPLSNTSVANPNMRFVEQVFIDTSPNFGSVHFDLNPQGLVHSWQDHSHEYCFDNVQVEPMYTLEDQLDLNWHSHGLYNEHISDPLYIEGAQCVESWIGAGEAAEDQQLSTGPMVSLNPGRYVLRMRAWVDSPPESLLPNNGGTNFTLIHYKPLLTETASFKILSENLDFEDGNLTTENIEYYPGTNSDNDWSTSILLDNGSWRYTHHVEVLSSEPFGISVGFSLPYFDHSHPFAFQKMPTTFCMYDVEFVPVNY